MKLEINRRKKTEKFINKWKLNKKLLTNQRANKEIKREIKNYLETNKNGNITYLNLWNEAKAALTGKFTAINAYIKIKEKNT